MNISPKIDPQVSRLFADTGKNYSQFRPRYPAQLGQALANLVSRHNIALDVGCGTGQLTALLNPHFNQVLATDINLDQINHAYSAENIRYIQSPAETLPFKDNTIDLIVAAQSAHWFDLSLFYKETQRIASPGAAIVLLSYGVPYIESSTNSVFQQGYWQIIHRHWPNERKHVETGYQDLPFDFTEIQFDDFFIHQSMHFQAFKNYIKTWSAYKQAKESKRLADFNQLFTQLETAWGDLTQPKQITWPIAARVGRID